MIRRGNGLSDFHKFTCFFFRIIRCYCSGKSRKHLKTLGASDGNHNEACKPSDKKKKLDVFKNSLKLKRFEEMYKRNG